MDRVHERMVKLLPPRPLTLEWIIVGIFLVVMVGFGLSYTRLLYERHQAQVQLRAVQAEVRREELRHHELEKLYRQAIHGGDIFVAQYAPRILRRAAPGTEIWLLPEKGETTQAVTSSQKSDASSPIWKQWYRVFFYRKVP